MKTSIIKGSEVSRLSVAIHDDLTLKLFDSNTNQLNPLFIKDIQALEEYSDSGGTTFLGPVYSQDNWETLQKTLVPVLKQRIRDKTDYGGSPFVWVAPSDPYWSKSARFISSLSDFLNRSATKDNRLYKPVLFRMQLMPGLQGTGSMDLGNSTRALKG
ncbi:hypothetical protein [Lelliottia sp. JS-SCA-14]|uniref:hypothetical protein n=1 Tax=Lelliottia sp. JS-SCA-14 TaxID=3110110 RepID=UPI002D76A819|nr:hypothetical protein [Lelliottia sp. JS-SCA-14]